MTEFRSESFTSAVDFSFSRTTLEASMAEGVAGVRASVENLQISIRVSAEMERALVETGWSRSGNPVADFRAASEGVLNRIAAERLSGSIQIELSFQRASVQIGAESGSSSPQEADLDTLAADGSLGGFITLLRAFFGDDERFEKFIGGLRKFNQDFSSGWSSDAPISAPSDSAGSVSVESTRVNVSIDVSVESTRVEVAVEGQATDPIVLDLDGDGVELTTAAEGVVFDLDADGVRERTATVAGGDGYLALDRNGDGRINDGKELFGDQHGAANGFAELRKFDRNRDLLIDGRDAIYESLRVFVDSNRDGVSQSDELKTLLDLNIASISLRDREVEERASGGNRIAQRSSFTRFDGTEGVAVDALLNRVV